MTTDLTIQPDDLSKPPADLNDYRAWLRRGDTQSAFEALLNHVAKMVGFSQIDTERWTKFSEELRGLRQAVESDSRARSSHSGQIAELQHSINRLTEWMRALDFDGRGVIVQEDTPPVLRLLAALLEENRELRAQNEVIIAQNKRGDAPADVAVSVRDLRRGQLVLAMGLALTLLLLAAHSWQMAQATAPVFGWLFGT